jgi:alkanesulfonate monooxygenase SsuD/methylene tetrahydromethanopterin reductase-like flavin-dependent oxidoreductase (luciferase family)
VIVVKIGIGLPNTMLDAEGRTFAAWAKRAEERGFSSLATIGRIAYPGFDELVTFGACAAVTERIGLLTNVLLAPLYPTPHLAKATATVDAISGGRLTLGLAVGGRVDDYDLMAQDLETRGRRFDRQLEELHEAWAGKPIGNAGSPVTPATTAGRIPILFGGSPGVAARRAVPWRGGYTIGGAPPEQAAGMVREFRSAYAELGGQNQPKIVALQYFSIGEEHADTSVSNLRSYYAWLGEWAEGVAQGAARSDDDLRARQAAYAEMGVDELIWDPSVADLDQVDRLADVVLA